MQEPRCRSASGLDHAQESLREWRQFNVAMFVMVQHPEYLNYAPASPIGRLQIELPARSTSDVQTTNSEEIGTLIIPLPSLEE